MGKPGPKALPNAIKAILGRKEQGVATSRKGHGLTKMKKYNKKY